MSSPHKLAFYVNSLLKEHSEPCATEVDLLEILAGGSPPRYWPLVADKLPVPQAGWDLDRWWEEVSRGVGGDVD